MLSLPPALVLHAPLLKVPFLIGNGIATYQVLTPREGVPSTKEREKAESTPGILRRHPALLRTVWSCATVSKYFFCGISFVEAALLVGYFPLRSHLDDIPAPLLPFATPWGVLQLTWTSVVGCTLGIAGGLIRTRCYRELRHLFTWEVAVRDDHRLVTTGPYSIVRHPSYTGYYLMLAGNVILLASKGSWFTESGSWRTVLGKGIACSVTVFLAAVGLRLFWRADEEDEVLKREFGDQWDEWAKRTPYRMIPFIY